MISTSLEHRPAAFSGDRRAAAKTAISCQVCHVHPPACCGRGPRPTLCGAAWRRMLRSRLAAYAAPPGCLWIVPSPGTGTRTACVSPIFFGCGTSRCTRCSGARPPFRGSPAGAGAGWTARSVSACSPAVDSSRLVASRVPRTRRRARRWPAPLHAHRFPRPCMVPIAISRIGSRAARGPPPVLPPPIRRHCRLGPRWIASFCRQGTHGAADGKLPQKLQIFVLFVSTLRTHWKPFQKCLQFGHLEVVVALCLDRSKELCAWKKIFVEEKTAYGQLLVHVAAPAPAVMCWALAG
jgi:hypothetical protein